MINRLRAQKRKAMSIKSEKAKEHIEEYQQDGFTHIGDAFNAIEIAESDARDRAVRAHAKECKYLVANRCILSEFHTECDLIPHCSDKKQFLKDYDNEQ